MQVVQLRQDNAAGSLNIVGFREQSASSKWLQVLKTLNLCYGGYAPAISYMDSNLLVTDFPVKIKPLTCSLRDKTGVEGYVESAASGLAAYNAARLFMGEDEVIPHHNSYR